MHLVIKVKTTSDWTQSRSSNWLQRKTCLHASVGYLLLPLTVQYQGQVTYGRLCFSKATNGNTCFSLGLATVTAAMPGPGGNTDKNAGSTNRTVITGSRENLRDTGWQRTVATEVNEMLKIG